MISICDDQSIISYFHVEVPGFCMSSRVVPFSVFACLWLCVHVCVCVCMCVCVCVCGHYTIGRES